MREDRGHRQTALPQGSLLRHLSGSSLICVDIGGMRTRPTAYADRGAIALREAVRLVAFADSSSANLRYSPLDSRFERGVYEGMVV